jgi:hypothetical protein
MKIFIGWPYEAVWVDQYVIPLVKSYGVKVITGKELAGMAITQGVKDRIAEADAALFITTRRGGPNAEGAYGTSDWVLDEIRYANALEKSLVLEVREEGVEYSNKIHDERQFTPFNSEDRLKCLVDIGNVVGQWRSVNLKLKLSPGGTSPDKEAFTDALIQRLGGRDYECVYRIRQQGHITHISRSVEIVREGQEQFIYAEPPASFLDSPDAFLEVIVGIGGMQWLSPGIRFNALEVPLERLDSVQRRRD